MAAHFKGGNLVLDARFDVGNMAIMAVQGGDLVIRIDDGAGTVRDVSITDLLRRVQELENSVAEMILLGEKKDG